MKTTLAAIAMLAGAALVGSGALAQQAPLIGADVTVKLSDPAGGDPWTVTESYAITYHGMTSCEAQIPNIQADYMRQVAAVDLLTPSGVPPVVEVEVTCVDRRQP